MSIVLDGLTKRFAGRAVVEAVGLEIADGELFVLLGASGSGKSTVLRMIAGLTATDGGKIELMGQDVTSLEPQKRGVGFVFQNYSIFQHMTAAENIAFGLRIRGVSRRQRHQKSEELLDLVGLGGLGERYARELSGGQQQRVALARALAYEPKVLLLDEPFGALDVKIRAQLRRSFREIQQRLRLTTVLVTHDQEEAFEIADRIGVFERGHLIEVGKPEELYGKPGSLYAATFLGAGTVLQGRCREGRAEFGPLSLDLPAGQAHAEGSPVRILIRPEQVELGHAGADGRPTLGVGRVVESSFAGALRRLRLRIPRLPRTRQISPPLPYGEEGQIVEAVLPASDPVPDEVRITLKDWRVLEQPLPSLLVADPLGAQRPPVAAARPLASALNASLVVLGVVPADNPPDPLRERFKTEFEQDADEIRIRVGEPAEQIRNEQAETFYDLVVLGPIGPKAIRSRSVRQLLREASTPLLFGEAREHFGKVLICTAVGEPGKSDVRVGGWLAGRLGAAVTLLHVSRDSAEPPRWIRAHLDQGVATLSAFDVQAQAQVRQADSPLEGILMEARKGDYDLVVIGGHGPRTRSMTGRDDIAFQILDSAKRPVLVVPEDSG
ncbi:MAG TPA: ATP-binding cassette domain-containing protein [Thermoanaerobaculia bacterium]|nr:ATP-binding cassette domain-containing protein [Thermoanaerobaculia bacterium]